MAYLPGPNATASALRTYPVNPTRGWVIDAFTTARWKLMAGPVGTVWARFPKTGAAAALGGGSPVPTTGQLWPRGSKW